MPLTSIDICRSYGWPARDRRPSRKAWKPPRLPVLFRLVPPVLPCRCCPGGGAGAPLPLPALGPRHWRSFRALIWEEQKMVVHEFTVDLRKPLVFQVGHLQEHYQEWVHQPIVSKEGPRFFRNDVMEFLTLTKWWVVPVIWLPVVCWLLAKSIQIGHTIREVVLMALFGVFVWTLIEYTLHRFLFHIETKSYWSNTAHYLIHGCHHKHPMDSLRLVFPPAGTAILCLPFWNVVAFFATPSTTPALFGGGLLGYVMYDCTHYYLHVAPWTAIQGSSKESQEVSPQPPFQNPGQGIRHHLIALGRHLRYFAFIQDRREAQQTLITLHLHGKFQ
uniref:Uncharacterized protein n=2 Tax=Avena sativa TaxID=4498 RepID=A0ACD6A5Q3_AVESA